MALDTAVWSLSSSSTAKVCAAPLIASGTVTASEADGGWIELLQAERGNWLIWAELRPDGLPADLPRLTCPWICPYPRDFSLRGSRSLALVRRSAASLAAIADERQRG